MNRRHLLILAALLCATSALAHDYKLGELQIQHPWARPSAARNGAAYMTIVTQGTADDRLLAVTSPVADRAELHTHILDGSVMRMRQVPSIDVKPGHSAELEPGGLHVMLFGLKQPLKAGASFPMTLTFERAGKIEIEVAVQRDGGAEGHGGHHPAPAKPTH